MDILDFIALIIGHACLLMSLRAMIWARQRRARTRSRARLCQDKRRARTRSKSKGRVSELKVLFMSGYTADIITRRGVLDENVDFIQKPFSLKSLAAKENVILHPTCH